MPEETNKEIIKIKERYEKRSGNSSLLYNSMNYDVIFRKQEFEKKLIQILRWENFDKNISELKLLEIGAGSGINLLKFIELGFKPENLYYNELLPERIETAKRILPSSIKILEGDARKINLPENSFDIVFQSTVFTSILDKQFKKDLAQKMWSLVKPNGGILWYDFIYNNPSNKDVKGIPVKEIKTLFPSDEFKIIRLTLAPPLSRAVTKIHPSLYFLLNIFPLLKTHLLVWIKK